MSEAESTIRFCILNGYAKATGQPNEDEARIDAILESLFHKETRWAISEYLKEIAESEV